MVSPASTMEPLSARLPSELYLWLAQLQVEGATTNSDKLRVLLGQLKRQHDGAFDYVAAHAWARDLTSGLRNALVRLEGQTGEHSAVLEVLLESLGTGLAMAISQVPADTAQAAKLEDALVRRAFATTESLLRQATTSAAAAYDPSVIQRHLGATIELATTIDSLKGR